MIKTYLITKDGIKEDVPLDAWKSTAKGDRALMWVDVRAPSGDEIGRLADVFGLHSVAVDSIADGYQRPHLYEFPDHFYINMTTVQASNRGNRPVKPSELHLLVGANWESSPAATSIPKAYRCSSLSAVRLPSIRA